MKTLDESLVAPVDEKPPALGVFGEATGVRIIRAIRVPYRVDAVTSRFGVKIVPLLE
jgi:hypothetical protein